MFTNPKNQRAWLNAVHPELGKAPLELLATSMEGLILVRQYLDYVRGRGA
ncbi:MAG: MbcA/ParS/Xre antitoxin family protein [Armatimonadota bacterium]